MFEGRRHAVDFGLADAGVGSDAAPVRDGFTDLPRDRAGNLALEAEIFASRERCGASLLNSSEPESNRTHLKALG